MKKCKNTLIINTFTWNKDSNELLDYESQDLIKTLYTIETDGFLSRFGDEIKFHQSLQDNLNKDEKILLHLECNSLQYFLVSNFSNKNCSEVPWLTLRHLKNKKYSTGYLINQGDLIKFGRLKLKIRDIKLEGRISNTIFDFKKETTLNVNVNYHSSEKKVEKRKRTCRICYCDDKEVDSPLINPCNCAGGLKYIHFSCLQQWLKSKAVLRSTSTDNCITYTFKQIECEICKQLLPDFIKQNSQVYEIWDFIKPGFKNYLSLETTPTDKLSNKSVYLVSLDAKSTIKIGRSHEADLRITDISVSRFHAQITKLPDSTLLIQDNNSKFGSLVLLQHPKIPIYSSPSLPLQIGRSLITLSLKSPWSFFGCFHCGGDSPTREVDYGKLNAENIVVEDILSVKVENDIDENSQESSFRASKKNIIDVHTIFDEKSTFVYNYPTANHDMKADEIDCSDLAIKDNHLQLKNKLTLSKIKTDMIENGNRLPAGGSYLFNNEENQMMSPEQMLKLNTLHCIDKEKDRDDLVNKKDLTMRISMNMDSEGRNKYTYTETMQNGLNKITSSQQHLHSNPQYININQPSIDNNSQVQIVCSTQQLKFRDEISHCRSDKLSKMRSHHSPEKISINMLKQYEEDYQMYNDGKYQASCQIQDQPPVMKVTTQAKNELMNSGGENSKR